MRYIDDGKTLDLLHNHRRRISLSAFALQLDRRSISKLDPHGRMITEKAQPAPIPRTSFGMSNGRKILWSEGPFTISVQSTTPRNW